MTDKKLLNISLSLDSVNTCLTIFWNEFIIIFLTVLLPPIAPLTNGTTFLSKYSVSFNLLKISTNWVTKVCLFNKSKAKFIKSLSAIALLTMVFDTSLKNSIFSDKLATLVVFVKISRKSFSMPSFLVILINLLISSAIFSYSK